MQNKLARKDTHTCGLPPKGRPPICPPSQQTMDILARPTRTAPRRPRRAMSLIEVVIGTVVLMLILLPAIASVSQSLRVIDKARDVTLASSMTQSVMEQLRMQTYATILATYPASSGSDYVDETHNSDGSVKSTSKLLACIRNSERFTTEQAKQYRMKGTFHLQTSGQLYVTLTTSWTDMNKKTQSYVMFTIISEGGLSDNVNKGW